MRITCPNCGAQYEVPEDAIPESGRDVQCSACGHTWLETGTAALVLRPTAGEEPAAPVVEAEVEVEVEPEPEPEPEVEPEPEPEPEPAPLPHPPPPRPALAPEVAAILREEAERERSARGTAPVLESQPDLGLDDGLDPEAQRAEEARRRMARLRGEAAPPTTAPVQPPSEPQRARERLPDIEEINSSLRAASERAPASVTLAEGPARGRGFRLGMSVVLILAALCTAVYVMAPQLGTAVPALKAPLDRYVAVVDDARLWLDLRVQGLLPDDAAGEGAPDPAAGTEPATPVEPQAETDSPAAPAAPDTGG